MKYPVPSVPGAFVMTDILSPLECRYIIDTAEAIGFRADHPITEDKSTGIDSCEWLASPGMVDSIFQRAKGLLPENMAEILNKKGGVSGGAGKVCGINPRFRLFRYSSDSVYRAHVDGSWTCGGLEPNTGLYNNDLYRDRRSRLTFLMYLNDGFDGGHTTFYVPSGDSNLKSYKVEPQMGGVLCFPQGNVASLIHEGSRVLEGGTKYVVRTDVMFFDK